MVRCKKTTIKCAKKEGNVFAPSFPKGKKMVSPHTHLCFPPIFLLLCPSPSSPYSRKWKGTAKKWPQNPPSSISGGRKEGALTPVIPPFHIITRFFSLFCGGGATYWGRFPILFPCCIIFPENARPPNFQPSLFPPFSVLLRRLELCTTAMHRCSSWKK